MIGGRDRQHPGDQFAGAVRIGAEDAGDEADIGARAFGVLEGLHVAERLHQHGQAVRLGLAAIGVDPFEHRVDRAEAGIRQRHRGGRRRRGEAERGGAEHDSEGEQTGGAAQRRRNTFTCEHGPLQRRKPAAHLTQHPRAARSGSEQNRPAGRFAGRSGAKSRLRRGTRRGLTAAPMPGLSISNARLKPIGSPAAKFRPHSA